MLLDSSFLIDLMEGRPEAVALAKSIDSKGDQLRLPAPVLFELWVGVGRTGGRAEDQKRLVDLETAYEKVGFDSGDARAAGELQATLHRSGRALGTVDVQLAGMAIFRSEELVTGDRALATVGHGVPVRSYRQK
ncbi:MAG: PIN domain-containing protein [Thermoplasmata archaeon]|nr:PIN domain-containing protein [Thermoplasmata archaeon]